VYINFHYEKKSVEFSSLPSESEFCSCLTSSVSFL